VLIPGPNNLKETIQGASSLTIAAWVKADALAYGVHQRILSIESVIFVGAYGSDIEFYTDDDGSGWSHSTVNELGSITTGKWYHLVWVKDGTSGYTYINGVSGGGSNQGMTLPATLGTNGNDVYFGGNYGTSQEWTGEIKDIRIHNRALSSDEVAASYNGESTSFEYADSAGDVVPSTSNSNAADWTENPAADLVFDSDHMEVSNTTANHGVYLTPANMGITATAGRRYRISAKIKNGSATGVPVSLQAWPLSGDAFVSHTTTSSFVLVSTEFTMGATAFSQVGVTPSGNLAGADIEFKDFRFEEVGEIAAYTPQSIAGGDGYKWHDTTSNENHGTITNATMVGTHNLGALTAVNGSVGIGTMTPTFATASGSTSVKGLNIQNVGQDTQASLRLTGHNATGNPGGATYTELRHRGDSLKFDIVHNNNSVIEFDSSANTKVFGKLGVGGVPSTAQLDILSTPSGAGNYLYMDDGANCLWKISSTTTSGIIQTQGTGWSSWKPMDLRANYFQFKPNNSEKMRINGEGVGIGETAPVGGLVVRTDDVDATPSANVSQYSLNIHGNGVGDGEEIGLAFTAWASGGSLTTDYTPGAAIVHERTGSNSQGQLHFRVKGSTTQNAALTTAMTLRDDGNQNHHANRIVNSQTVSDLHRTAEPSLRFDGTDDEVSIADNNALDLATDGTVVVIFRATNVGSASVATSWQSIVSKRSGATCQYEVGIEDNGRMFLYNGSTVNYFAFIPTNDVWTHCAVVWSGATASLYINGVFKESTSNALGAVNAHSLGIGAIPNSGGQRFNGEIKDVRIHNRALEDTEVAAAYNGESTPFIYEDANSANLSASATFTTAASGGYHIESLTNVTSTGFTWDNTSSSGRVTSGANAFVFEAGKKYRLTAKINKTSGTGDQQVYVRETWDSGTVAAEISTANGNNVLQTIDFIAPADTTLGVHFSTANVAAGTVSDISVVRVGEVAAYTPMSIGDKWYDTTSNKNHGAIVGATVTGQNRLGSFNANGTYSTPTFTKTTATTNAVQNVLAIEADCTATAVNGFGPALVFRHTDALQGVQDYSILESYMDGAKSWNCGLRYRNYDTGVTNKTRFDIKNNGEVQATSATSDNLRPVCRVTTATITGNNSSANFAIVHNLGTTSIVVSVREQTSYQHVECAISTVDGSSVNSIDNCRVSFATAPGTGVKYDVTVMG